MTKFVAMSDLHGNLVDLSEPADVLLLGGDIVPLNIQMNGYRSKMWFRDDFISWIDRLPVSQVVMVGGNHDMYLEFHGIDKFREMVKDRGNITYLENSCVDLGDDITIYGTPLCKPFGNWSFMISPDKQQKIYKEDLEGLRERIEEGRKVIVLSHDAPLGCSDIILQKSCPWYTDDHIGNPQLRTFLEDLKPTLNIHGHLHSTNHEAEYLNDGDTEVRCVSILDENYRVAYEPYYFEL